MLLATHPEVQSKVRAEVVSQLPVLGAQIEWGDLEKLEYLTAVIKEAQRLEISTFSPVFKFYRIILF